ncbi:cation channel sperm-associated protein 2 isoform X2 [Cavia porcellus]|uniref:cation channel sperm-associated protein 2 isoform X2 n=1 Tax=Cavia porcellus TaxID=10141 RepID=UPI0003512BF8
MVKYTPSGHMQLPRADAIRSRRIDLEHFQVSDQPMPLYTTREIIDPSYLKSLRLRDQHQQVRFSTKPRYLGRVSHGQRLLCRFHVRHGPWPPLSLWAQWVIEHAWFKNMISFLIVLNAIVRMITTELLDSTNTQLWLLKLSLEVVIWFILPVFIVEILLKWIASFSLYWKNPWNIFDFVITLLPFLYEILVLGGVTGHPVWLELMSICGVMRCFRLYAQFHQVRVIILALVRTFKNIRFHFMLLLIFFYIFAVAGVYFFKDYSRSTRQDLVNPQAFFSLPNSLITIFILFTMDQWNALLRDLWKVPEVSSTVSSIYIILWVLLGSIILRNVIISTMANNFQDIRDELDKEMAHLAAQHKADFLKLQILRRRQNASFATLRSSHSKVNGRDVSHWRTSVDFQEPPKKESKHSAMGKELKVSSKKKESLPKREDDDSSSTSSSSEHDQLDWENLVHQNLPELIEMDQEEYTVWPKNLVLRYLELLEKLQYNLEERKELQQLAAQALMNFQDR